MTKIFYHLLIINCLIGLAGCHTSYIYNTSLQLPSEPMKTQDIQITGEIGMLPEALPNSTGKHAVFSGGVLARYAASDNFYIDARAYTALNDGFDMTDYPSGAGIGANIILNESKDDFVYGLRLTYERAWTGSSDGDGIGAQVFSWFPSFYSIRPYGAIGTACAFGEDGFLGYGFMGNLGCSYAISDFLDFNIEFAPIRQINTEYDVNHWVYSATAGLSFKL